MATVKSWELQSFVSKFLQLSSYGYQSCLNFKFNGEHIEVNINATLGSPPVLKESFMTEKKHVKPSRLRRRIRRKEARVNNPKDTTLNISAADIASDNSTSALETDCVLLEPSTVTTLPDQNFAQHENGNELATTSVTASTPTVNQLSSNEVISQLDISKDHFSELFTASQKQAENERKKDMENFKARLNNLWSVSLQ